MSNLSQFLYPLVNLTDIQKRYLCDSHRFQVVTAGRRSRKTLIAKRKLLLEAMRTPEMEFIHLAPTHQQAKSIFWADLLRYTKHFQKKVNYSQLEITLLNDAIIKVAGADRPERLEGQAYPPIKGMHFTEVRYMKPDVWDRLRPVLSDTNGWALLDSAPRRNHWYNHALYASGNALPVPKPIVGAYAENPDDDEWSYYSWLSADVLDARELEKVKNQLDPKTFEQEYMASFEGVDGLAYYAFSEDNIKENKWIRNLPVYVGLDFNVDPMCAVLCHYYNNTIFQFGEVRLVNSNTEEMTKFLRRYYIESLMTIYPDATGGARKTSSNTTDLEILKRVFRDVIHRKANPYQRDRVNCVNSWCRSLNGQIRYLVDPSCKHTINDLRRMERFADGTLNKTTESTTGIGHQSDGLGYLMWGLMYMANARFEGMIV